MCGLGLVIEGKIEMAVKSYRGLSHLTQNNLQGHSCPSSNSSVFFCSSYGLAFLLPFLLLLLTMISLLDSFLQKRKIVLSLKYISIFSNFSNFFFSVLVKWKNKVFLTFFPSSFFLLSCFSLHLNPTSMSFSVLL